MAKKQETIVNDTHAQTEADKMNAETREYANKKLGESSLEFFNKMMELGAIAARTNVQFIVAAQYPELEEVTVGGNTDFNTGVILYDTLGITTGFALNIPTEAKGQYSEMLKNIQESTKN